MLARQPAPARELYPRLGQRNPAPFAGYMAHADWEIVSASPERFVSLREGFGRDPSDQGDPASTGDPEARVLVQGELFESEKDHAENVMIVDLLRNDLSRVCRPSSVTVPLLCGVEVYETVLHLVSQIPGVMREGPGRVGFAGKPCFPGGRSPGAQAAGDGSDRRTGTNRTRSVLWQPVLRRLRRIDGQ
ncbi:MAG: hypothetical protein Ct9H300mP1_15330 [Planctomycetaceae bacterium]|nr:MAG: hypothetical protein Ct9H300mP1_15330 [Planctomycetaceae bacterium]